MPDFIPFALPDISETEIASVVETLRSGWITTGPKTKEFERRFAEATGAPHAVMLNSCTAALHLALEAIGVKRGDEIIVPSITFTATAEVVRYFDAVPVIVDVRSFDHNIDPSAVERALTPKTRAIIPVHFAGSACDMDEIVAIARPRGIAVIDDAAHAFPSSYKGRKVGTLADISCFSFYATKTITTGEGGAAVTANPDWAARMRIMALHGISRDAWNRYAASGTWYYEVVAPGYKYNLTDVASALGLGQLARAVEMRDERARIAASYDEAFRRCDALELLSPAPNREHAHHLYVIKLRTAALSIDRARFIDELKALGIGTSVHFIPLHMHPYYRDQFGYLPDALPVSLEVYSRSISLPVYSKMTKAEAERVVTAVLDIVANHRR